MKEKIHLFIKLFDLEAFIWISGIIILAFSDPYNEAHFTLFPPTLLFDIKSPGYNLGHSISHFFHGNILLSLQTHPLGIIAVLILLYRSFYIVRRSYLIHKKKENDNG